MSQFSNEWWLLVNGWTGKALAFNVVTPLVLWPILTMEDTDPAERKSCWQVLFVVGCSACLIAASLFMSAAECCLQSGACPTACGTKIGASCGNLRCVQSRRRLVR